MWKLDTKMITRNLRDPEENRVVVPEYKVPLEFPTIQLAVDFAKEGGRIVLADGVFYESVVITKSLEICKWSGCIHPPTVASKGAGCLYVERGASVKLTGLAISVLDAKFSDPSSHCVQVDGASLVLENVSFSGGVSGVCAFGRSSVVGDGCKFHHQLSWAIACSEETSIRGSNFSIDSCDDTGIMLCGNSKATFSSCDVIKSGIFGIHIAQGSVAELSNVSVTRNKGEGIIVNGVQSHVICRHCKVQHNDGTGISVMLGATANIQECDLRFNKLGPLYGSAPKGSNPFAAVATFDGPIPDAPDAHDPRAVSVPAPAPGLGLPVWTDFITQSRNIGVTDDGQAADNEVDEELIAKDDGSIPLELILDADGYPLGGNPVGPWLDAMGLSMYRPVFKLAKIFIMNDIYFKRDQDLMRMGVSVLEHRKKMIEAMGKYAGKDSKENAEEPMQKSEFNKQEIAVAKKTRTALEMKALAKSLRRSSGGGGVIKAGQELDMDANQSSISPTRGQGDADDKTDAESIVFMEQGRQLYDTSRARGRAAADSLTKVRPTTAKSGVSGSVRPSSAFSGGYQDSEVPLQDE